MGPADPLQPTSRFTGCADAYAKHRPSYPPAAIDATLAGAPAAHGLRVIDIGAGTGISARLYAQRGCAVTAIEPNAEMRAAGEREDTGRRPVPPRMREDAGRRPVPPRIRWVDGTAERTGLPDACADLVVCAQAFHWFDPPRALREFARILDPRSPLRRVALVWNIQDSTDAGTAGYQRIIAAHAVEEPASPWRLAPGEPLATEDARAAGFAGARVERFPSHQELDEDGLVGRALSASYMPRDVEKRSIVERELRALFREFAEEGVFRVVYRTEVHMAERS